MIENQIVLELIIKEQDFRDPYYNPCYKDESYLEYSKYSKKKLLNIPAITHLISKE